MRRWLVASLAALAIVASVPASAQQPPDDGEGVKVRRASLIRKLVSAERLEKAALVQYDQLRRQAVSRNALLPAEDAHVKRVQRIASELLPYTHKWHDKAKAWKWDVIVVKSPTINALCMPGGKIAVFTGLLEGLKLSDDEVAVVLGHEMAHALREHARARAAKITLTNVGTMAIGLVIGGNVGELARQGGGLLALKFNRDDERDADLIGLELAARAGYDPQSGLTLWEKMSAAAKRTPPQWLSTHPSSEDRIRRMKEALPQVLPLYAKAKAARPPVTTAPN